jgi:uncharacterized glyoxalase superfamily protein PhnB
MPSETRITPVLTVSDAALAAPFYERAFAAREIHRNTYPNGRIVVEMSIDGARFRVADEAPEAGNPRVHRSPPDKVKEPIRLSH